jgi:hypothetical protein
MEQFNKYIKSLEDRISNLENLSPLPSPSPSPSPPEPEGNIVWENKWNNPYREMLKARQPDIYDTLTSFRGDGKCVIENGIMKLSGRQPRLYVNIDIQDVEVNIKYMKNNNDGVNWSGCNAGVRSHTEGHSQEPDKAHTYYFRLRNDNKIDFYRELEHAGKNNKTLISKKYDWEDNKWYSYKFRCFNEGGEIKLEGYINDKLVLKYSDNNEKMFSNRGCVFIRNTSITNCEYKDFSIGKIIL